MQTNRRLVQYVYHAHQRRTYLSGQTYALCLAARQRGRRARQGEVIQANIPQKAQTLANLLEYLRRNHALPLGKLEIVDKLERIAYGHVAELRNRQPAHSDR